MLKDQFNRELFFPTEYLAAYFADSESLVLVFHREKYWYVYFYDRDWACLHLTKEFTEPLRLAGYLDAIMQEINNLYIDELTIYDEELAKVLNLKVTPKNYD